MNDEQRTKIAIAFKQLKGALEEAGFELESLTIGPDSFRVVPLDGVPCLAPERFWGEFAGDTPERRAAREDIYVRMVGPLPRKPGLRLVEKP